VSRLVRVSAGYPGLHVTDFSENLDQSIVSGLAEDLTSGPFHLTITEKCMPSFYQAGGNY